MYKQMFQKYIESRRASLVFGFPGELFQVARLWIGFPIVITNLYFSSLAFPTFAKAI